MAFGRGLGDHRVSKPEISIEVCIVLHNFPLLSREHHFSIKFSSRVEYGNKEPIKCCVEKRMFSSPFINNDNTSMVRLWRHINMVNIVTKTQRGFRQSHVEMLCKIFRSALHHYMVFFHSSCFHNFLSNHPSPPPKI